MHHSQNKRYMHTFGTHLVAMLAGEKDLSNVQYGGKSY